MIRAAVKLRSLRAFGRGGGGERVGCGFAGKGRGRRDERVESKSKRTSALNSNHARTRGATLITCSAELNTLGGRVVPVESEWVIAPKLDFIPFFLSL